MRPLLIIALGLGVVVPGWAHAQTCVLSGRGLTHDLRVDPPNSSQPFDVQIRSQESTATLEANHRDAVIRARGWLDFQGTRRTAELEVALHHAVSVGGVLSAGADRAFRVTDLRMNADGLVATLRAANTEVRDAPLPCTAVLLTDARQERAYRRGFEGEQAIECAPRWMRRAPRAEIAACELAYAEGWTAGQRAGARDSRESASNGFVPTGTTLHVFRTPGATDPLVVRVDRPRDFAIDVIERQLGWSHIRVEWGPQSHLDGWVRDNTLRVPTPRSDIGMGNLGTLGHGSGVGSARTGISGIVEPGTPVFASPTASAPWATVRGIDSVQMVLHDSWVELTEVDGVEMRSPGGMWVRRDRVRTGISSANGLTLTEVHEADTRSIRIDWVSADSRAFEIGLRNGDFIESINRRSLGEFVDYQLHEIRDAMNPLLSITVRRGAELLELIDQCELMRERELASCPMGSCPPMREFCPL